MASSPQDIRLHLMATDEHFRELAEQHKTYDEQLQQLSNRPYLSDQEKVEEIRLKKLKLRLKDEMEQLIRQYKKDHASVA
jgi:uncharacterized protein YdcH (DUF465 family)